MTRKLSIIAGALDSDLRKSIAEARQLGFAGIQLPRATRAFELAKLSSSGQRELAGVLRTNQIEPAGIRLELDKTGLSPGADVDAALDRIESVLQTAADFRAGFVCVDIGPLPEPPAETQPAPPIPADKLGLILLPEMTRIVSAPVPAEPFDAAAAQSVDSALAELGNRADRYGVFIAFGNELASFAALHRALRAARCPWFGIDLNPPAVLRDQWSMDEIFARFSGDIRHVRGRDAILGAQRRARPAVVGQGSMDWKSFLALLDDAGYTGWITIDPIELQERRGSAILGMGAIRQLE